MATTASEKSELLTRMRAGWAEVEASYGQLSPEQQSTLKDAAGWTPKDHLGHLGTWLWVALARVDGSEEASIFGMDDGTYATTWAEPNGIDALNAAAVRLQRGKSYQTLLNETRALHRQLVGAVQALSEAQLDRLPFPDEPDRGRLVDQVAGNSYEHYQEHVAYLRALLGQ